MKSNSFGLQREPWRCPVDAMEMARRCNGAGMQMQWRCPADLAPSLTKERLNVSAIGVTPLPGVFFDFRHQTTAPGGAGSRVGNCAGNCVDVGGRVDVLPSGILDSLPIDPFPRSRFVRIVKPTADPIRNFAGDGRGGVPLFLGGESGEAHPLYGAEFGGI